MDTSFWSAAGLLIEIGGLGFLCNEMFQGKLLASKAEAYRELEAETDASSQNLIVTTTSAFLRMNTAIRQYFMAQARAQDPNYQPVSAHDQKMMQEDAEFRAFMELLPPADPAAQAELIRKTFERASQDLPDASKIKEAVSKIEATRAVTAARFVEITQFGKKLANRASAGFALVFLGAAIQFLDMVL